MLTETDATLIVDSETSTFDWCVYEHYATLAEGDPPTLIMVGASKLTDVYHLADGKMNSDWASIFENGGKLIVRIIATSTDKEACFRHAQQLMREKTPRCNIKGRNLKNARRALICLTNGKRYDTQNQAATDLNLAQSALSRHLRGKQKHVCGLVFAYERPEGAA